jgi:hypothetical protein
MGKYFLFYQCRGVMQQPQPQLYPGYCFAIVVTAEAIIVTVTSAGNSSDVRKRTVTTAGTPTAIVKSAMAVMSATSGTPASAKISSKQGRQQEQGQRRQKVRHQRKVRHAFTADPPVTEETTVTTAKTLKPTASAKMPSSIDTNKIRDTNSSKNTGNSSVNCISKVTLGTLSAAVGCQHQQGDADSSKIAYQ